MDVTRGRLQPPHPTSYTSGIGTHLRLLKKHLRVAHDLVDAVDNHNMRRPRVRCIIFAASLFVFCVILISKYIWDMPYSVGSIRTTSNPHEITIVTMYINIGGFLKNGGNNYFTPATYTKWMTTWGWLTNRVVAFFDNDADVETFRKIRSVHPADKTVLIKLQRQELPAFNKLDTIRTIYQNASYPKFTPDTVFAEYSCAMNAKYDVLQMAVQRGLVHTQYMAWLGIGLFRNLLEPKLRPKDDRFTLEVPENFNSSTVGMSQVTPGKYMSKVSPWEYIKKGWVWVSGAFVLATQEVLMKFAQSYTLMANELIDKGMSSTDQTVIGAMYSPEYIKRQPVDIVDYKCHGRQFGLYETDVIYFCLGHICKNAAQKRTNENTNRPTGNFS